MSENKKIRWARLLTMDGKSWDAHLMMEGDQQPMIFYGMDGPEAHALQAIISGGTEAGVIPGKAVLEVRFGEDSND